MLVPLVSPDGSRSPSTVAGTEPVPVVSTSACCAQQVLIGATELRLHSVPGVFSMATPFTPPNRLLLSRPVRAGEGPGSGTSSVSVCC